MSALSCMGPGKFMSVKINNSAFFLAVAISFIYAAFWLLFSIFFEKVAMFSAGSQIQPGYLPLMAGLFYLLPATFVVFIIMKKKVREVKLLQSKLEIAAANKAERIKPITPIGIFVIINIGKTASGFIPSGKMSPLIL